MAILLKLPAFKCPPSLSPSPRPTPLSHPRPFNVCFKERLPRTTGVLRFSSTPSFRFVKLVPFASNGGETETTETQHETQEPQIEDSSDGAVSSEEDTTGDGSSDFEDTPSSAIASLLLTYKEALASNDETKVAAIEDFLNSIEDEKVEIEKKMASLSDELSVEKDRIIRISADFDNFRKRTERERLSLVSNTQGEVLENLLPVLDNFERAKAQIKVETEGEEKINNSYQSIYKQFMEILGSLGVEPVETVGNHFDPMLHEAIMQEDSAEFEEGIILQEFRKGFKLGDRLLRPSMVKVSAGPGPAKPEQGDSSEGADAGESTMSSETVKKDAAESSETTKTDTGSEEAS
ncbi:embryo defective 1241, Chloroplast GrpE 1 [Hibiscus trionum]|uniref:GrpE protein homolog n=1 Tax=Hibiscus trionum TaxID=183268 RepID=A0A9W7JEE4_HIBTR|nr:embryo defective 1241, Chloroplast GrpE 1 [Hibiscus trionum]